MMGPCPAQHSIVTPTFPTPDTPHLSYLCEQAHVRGGGVSGGTDATRCGGAHESVASIPRLPHLLHSLCNRPRDGLRAGRGLCEAGRCGWAVVWTTSGLDGGVDGLCTPWARGGAVCVGARVRVTSYTQCCPRVQAPPHSTLYTLLEASDVKYCGW
eukprot:365300-Chlamydomonas_euryale.AAC.13